jgi:hypothetical protein
VWQQDGQELLAVTDLGVDTLMEDSFERFSSLFPVGRGQDHELLDDAAADEAISNVEHDARCLGTPSDPSLDGCTMSGRQWVEEKSGECCRSPASPAAAAASHCAPSVADVSAFASWATCDRYRLVRLLGHGSGGEVAEAWDTVACPSRKGSLLGHRERQDAGRQDDPAGGPPDTLHPCEGSGRKLATTFGEGPSSPS